MKIKVNYNLPLGSITYNNVSHVHRHGKNHLLICIRGVPFFLDFSQSVNTYIYPSQNKQLTLTTNMNWIDKTFESGWFVSHFQDKLCLTPHTNQLYYKIPNEPIYENIPLNIYRKEPTVCNTCNSNCNITECRPIEPMSFSIAEEDARS